MKRRFLVLLGLFFLSSLQPGRSAADPTGVAAQAFAKIAARLWEKVSQPERKAGPRIVID